MTTHHYDRLTSALRLMNKTLACFLFLILTAGTTFGYPVTLMIHPSKISESAETYRLFETSEELTDTDAFPLYEKAIQQMPKGVNQKKIHEWFKLPFEQFPQKEAENVIQKYSESLRLVARATRCGKCNWPQWKPGQVPPDVKGYRDLAYILRTQARLDYSRGRHKDTLAAMQTSFGIAKHLGQAPTIIQAMVGGAIGGVTCREIESFVQCKDSPNLYAALANLPEPLTDVNIAIESESANLKDYNILLRKQFEKQLKPAHEKVRLNAKRLDNHVKALQVVESIRHYAATHDGQLPEALSDIKDQEVPNDLISGKAFEYRRTVEGAMLKSAIPEGGKEKDTIHYEIELKK